jgi:hypothetical protein
VITGGELFSRFAKKHKYLAFMAYIILVASGIFVIREIYNELIYIIENVETLSFFYLVKLLTAIAICIIAPMLALSESKAVLEAAEQEPTGAADSNTPPNTIIAN